MKAYLLTLSAACTALLLGACKKDEAPPLYEPVPVERRDIVVSAEAAGTVEPILVVDVKSKASGEILELTVETGDMVQQGDLLVRVDPRDPNNAVLQAEADLEVARAQLANAEAQKRRADQMFAAQVLSEQEHDNANLTYANARAQLVRAERSLQTARDQLDDTNVRAPITGTIIQKSVERGQVIASATREVSGGTVLLRMADLNEVQVRTLVDETDIGKVQPSMRATITVDAYPNRPFEGSVLKIEPQSQTQQNVTMFPVLIRIPNEQALLRPGMNAEVEIHIGQRQGVLAIPNTALRTERDVSSAAQVLGLNEEEVQRTLAAQDSIAGANPQVVQAGAPTDRRTDAPTDRQAGGRPERAVGGSSFGGRSEAAGAPAAPAAAQAARARPQDSGMQRGGDALPQPGQPPLGSQGAPFPGGFPGAPSGPGGMGGMRGGNFQLPEGITREQAQEAFRKRMAGEPLTAQDSQVLARIRAARQAAGAAGGEGMGGPPGGQPPAASGQQPAASGQQPAASGQQPAAGGQMGSGERPQFQPPPGVTEQQARDIMRKRFSGAQLTREEQAIATRLMQQFQRAGGAGGAGGAGQRRRFGSGNTYQYGGSYIVFTLKNGKPTPTRIRTGLTDMDYSEVVSGLTDKDTVLLLPSASLVQQQTEMRDRFQRMSGGGAVPGMRQQAPGGAGPGPGARPTPGGRP